MSTTTGKLDVPPPRAEGRRPLSWLTPSAVLDKLGPAIGLVFVFCLFAILRPGTFLTPYNLQIMLLQTAVVGTAALGMTMIIITGGIDLSVGSNIALCTVAVALALPPAVHAGEAPPLVPWFLPPLAALAGIAASTLVGLLVGSFVAKLKLIPFIVSLGMWGAVRGAAKGLAHLARGEGSSGGQVHSTTTWLSGLLTLLGPGGYWMLVPPGVWIMLVLAVFVACVLRYTRFGRHIFAIGSNEQTARLCGVRVDRVKILTYCFAAVFVGIAGLLEFSRLNEGDPTTANGLELDIIAACVIGGASLSGGQGSVFGSLVGALIMTVVKNGCTKIGLDTWVQEIVTGGIIILAVYLDRFRHNVSK